MTRRLEQLEYDKMTPDQQRMHDEILAGPRSGIGGPMNAWFRSPELGSLSQKLGAYCRYNTSLPPRLSELIILVVGRHWTAQVEWYFHAPVAEEAGISPDIVEAIRIGGTPNFEQEDEATVYAFCHELAVQQRVSDETYRRAIEQFGEATVVEIVGVVGYYSYVAMVLTAFREPTPDNSEPLKPIK